MNVIRTDSELKIRSEYHPDLPKRARKIGGKWEAYSKLWVFDIRDEHKVAELYESIYGYWDTDGEPPPDAVTVRITANYDIDALRSGVFFAGRLVVTASSRDSGAWLGPGILQETGKIDSGGSIKNWDTIIDEGTTFEIKDVPLNLVKKERETEYWSIEIVTSPEQEALLSEKRRMIERVEEIDMILESYNSDVTDDVTTV